MPRRNHIPAYRLHRQSGQAIVTLTDGLGRRRDYTLGVFDSSESRAKYATLLAEWEANDRHIFQPAAANDITITELIDRFWPHVESYYRHPDGTPSKEPEDFKFSLRPLKHLYGDTSAKSFGPIALKAVRKLMIEGYDHPKYGPQRALARSVINQRIGRIKHLFKWAVSEEILQESVYRALLTVQGLPRGRSGARETRPVRPVADAVVEATLPFLRPQLAAIAQIQRYTGMRPGELVIMRGMDLEMSDNVWVYRPGSDQGPHGKHKTAWRGHDKVIHIGPKAQEILKPWLRLNLTEYLFQPREAMAAFRAEQHCNRKTKVQPSQKNRSRARPKKRPGERYTTRSYAKAITNAVEKATTARACGPCKPLRLADRCEACKAAAIPHWHPHQLRHSMATEIRREYGLDPARAVLGQRSPKVTEIYAEIDMNKAAEVMASLG